MRYIKILKDLMSLNRHHISPDMDIALGKLSKMYHGNVDEYIDEPKLSWRIPPGYKVIKAELKDSEGNLICSHEQNPLHLWSYSPSYSGYIDYSDLKKRIIFDPKRPEAIVFHFRNQYRFWKPVWGFSLNQDQYSLLNKNKKYFVDIETEFYDSPLKQHIINKPKDKNNLILVSHIDHYNQLNDGLGSVIVNNEVVSELNDKLENINLCSLNSIEIVGSVYFLNKYKLNSSNTIAAISTNGLTLNTNLRFQLSGKKGSNINKLFTLFNKIYKSNSSIEEFRDGWGNDEIAYEVPGINIPCTSIHRDPHLYYHTNLDDFTFFSDDSFNESKDLIKNIILCLDKNYTVKIKNWNGLICLAHPDVDLYIEPMSISNISQNSNLEKFKYFEDVSAIEIEYLISNQQIVRNFCNKFQSFLSNNENITIIDIAFEFSLPVSFVIGYFEELKKRGFLSLDYRSQIE